MSFAGRSTDELVRIVLAGGSVSLDAGARSTDDLVRIALAGHQSGARLIIRGASGRSSDDLIRISLAGRGRVHFE